MKMLNNITGIVIQSIENIINPKEKTVLDVLFHRKVKNINNSSINLHPKGIGKGYEKYQSFSKEVIDKVKVTMGYVSNFRNSGEEAILIHGNKNGRVALYSHFVDNRKEFTVRDFISHIKKVHNIDISKKTKAHYTSYLVLGLVMAYTKHFQMN